MSMIGTSVAQGVAQAGLQAQQVARQHDRAVAQTERARQVAEAFEAHLKTLEEGDEDRSPSALRTDPDLPEHQHPEQQPDGRRKKAEPAALADAGPAAEDAARPFPPESDQPLYRHLDVKA